MHLNRKSIKPLFETWFPIILPESYSKDTGVSHHIGAPLVMRSPQASRLPGWSWWDDRLFDCYWFKCKCDSVRAGFPVSNRCSRTSAHGQKWLSAVTVLNFFNNVSFKLNFISQVQWDNRVSVWTEVQAICKFTAVLCHFICMLPFHCSMSTDTQCVGAQWNTKPEWGNCGTSTTE